MRNFAKGNFEWLFLALSILAPMVVQASPDVNQLTELDFHYKRLSEDFPISDYTIVVGYADSVDENNRPYISILSDKVNQHIGVEAHPYLIDGATLMVVVFDQSGAVVMCDVIGNSSNQYVPGASRSLVAGPIHSISDSGDEVRVGQIIIDVNSADFFPSHYEIQNSSVIFTGLQYPHIAKLFGQTVTVNRASASVGTGRGNASVGTG
ncbi:MAG: hypothetical protein ACO3K0_05890, partial [Steroidobacteraceae bacterium]